MQVIVGHTRSRALVRRLEALGWGRCMVDARLDPYDCEPWMLDNGAYAQAAAQARAAGFPSLDAAIRAGAAVHFEYDFEPFERKLEELERVECWSQPRIVVVPDRPGDPDSLDFSLLWWHDFWPRWYARHDPAEEETFAEEVSWWLPVQDGVAPEQLDVTCPDCQGLWAVLRLPIWDHFRGIFLGGSARWKAETAPRWRAWCAERGLELHYARAGTPEKARYAAQVGADSLDSAFPLWTTERFECFADQIQNGPAQHELFP